MKRNEVFSVLKISKTTLGKYVREGKIRAVRLPNGYWDYNEEDIYAFANKDHNRLNVIYVQHQYIRYADQEIDNIKNWCSINNIIIDEVYRDVCESEIINRNGLNELIQDVIKRKIDTVYILDEIKLSIAYQAYKELFASFGTKIVVISKQIKKDFFKKIKENS